MVSSRGALDLKTISLRDQERGFVIGGSGSGKSTLMDVLGLEWDSRYRARGGRRLILDTKPRYRAQWTADGRDARKRYRNWAHGNPIAGSYVVDDPEQLDLCWQLGARVVIAQGESSADLPRLTATAARFLKQSKASRPQLAQVDETLDFFNSNGSPRGGDDIIIRLPRAGRERGTASLFGSQRTKGIPTTIMEEMVRLYAFVIDFKADAKRLQEMGAPDFELPKVKHIFKYWWKDGDRETVYGPYKLNLGGKS